MSPLSYVQLNEDLFGEIELLSQTGPFSIPVHCTTRKCIVRVTRQGDRDGKGEVRDKESGEGSEVDFGRVCIGETVKRCVILHNDGALPTEFTITATTSDTGKVRTCKICCFNVCLMVVVFHDAVGDLYDPWFHCGGWG